MKMNAQEQALIDLYEIVIKRLLTVDSLIAAEEILRLIVDYSMTALMADAVILYEYYCIWKIQTNESLRNDL